MFDALQPLICACWILFLVSLPSICIGQAATQPATTRPSTVRYVASDGSCTIDADETWWFDLRNVLPTEILSISNDSGSLGFISLNVVGGHVRFEDVAVAEKKQASLSYPDQSAFRSRRILMDGTDAIEMTRIFQVRDTRYQEKRVVFHHDGKVYTLALISEPKYWNTREPEFDEILRSFKFAKLAERLQH